MASMASQIGVARRPTQGSCRPVVTTSTGLPATSMVLPGTWMLEVGLNVDVHDDVLPRGNAAQDAAGVVAQETRGRQLVAMLAAALRGRRDAGADFHGLHRVDAHHGVREVGIEPVEHRLAQTRRHALRHHRDLRADRIARRRGSST